MSDDTSRSEGAGGRPRIALVTNHGYAGVEIPVGGAPDTGGQNFYVNSLARSLGSLGWEVTIFARGGFPFFGTTRIREGTERLTDHVRYVYAPGGGDEFIRKEDIAVALDEETAWIARFVCDEASAAGVAPWEYFECVNTHYWDAAVIAVRLVERWRDQAAMEALRRAAGGVLERHLEGLAGDERHRLGLSREIRLHLGLLGRRAAGSDDPGAALRTLLGPDAGADDLPGPFPRRDPEAAIALGEALLENLRVDGAGLGDLLDRADRHVWTPHSLGIVKERNFWRKDPAVVRALKFRERDAHEDLVCRRTRLFCSTSSEIRRGLVSYHGVDPSRVFDFPPCIDAGAFRPRARGELDAAYDYLSEMSGLSVATLEGAAIVFETSRMDRTKRKDVLLEAFDRVAREVEGCYLFVGGGPAESEVFRDLAELKGRLPALEGRAFLLGFVPDEVLAHLFSVADLFVSASEMEGFGMSASQAAAAGAAIVTSDLVPFATEWAPDAAVVVPAGDVDGFAEATIRLLVDEGERRARADRLREIAAGLDWASTAGRFVDWFGERLPG